MTIWTLGLILLAPTNDSWPGFLGANQRDVKTLPLQWSPTQNLAWTVKTPGHGQSSPVIWGQRVYLTAIEGPMKDTNHVFALNLADGKEVWRHSTPSSMPVKDSYFVSRAAPTPVADENHVYAFFESGDLIALTHDGKPAWSRSLTKEYGAIENKFGISGSPVAHGDAVFVMVDDTRASYLLAARKRDGGTIWKVDRPPRQSWTSPALITIGEATHLVCSADGAVVGYEPATGQELWSFNDFGGNTGTSPIPQAPNRMLIGASPGRQGERAAAARKSNLCLMIEAKDATFTPKVAWRTDKATVGWASPMSHAGRAYWVNSAGVLFCFDDASGELLFSERLKQSCWATPLGVGDRVYLFGRDGLTTVIEAASQYKVLASNEFWDSELSPPAPAAPAAKENTPERQRAAAAFGRPIVYGIAAMDGVLVVRTGDTVHCIREGNPPRP